jgi:aminoglycoside 3-N-acetyltransferase
MNRSELAGALSGLGLRRGDIVLVHSALSAIGPLDGGGDALLDAFLDVVGAEGTLVVPTFGALGKLTELVASRPGAVKSVHPVASVAALGKDAAKICAGHWKAGTAHGEDTPYTRMAEMGAWICLIGVDQDRNTTLHTVEALMRLPYLKDISRTFPGPDGVEMTRTWKFFPGPHRDFIGLDRVLRESGKMTVGMIGRAVTRLVRSRDLIDTIKKEAEKNPAFALCSNPACADCVAQRADIRRDRLKAESFTLTTSALLAGRYPAEIIESCKAAGVDFVELDFLQGLPVGMLPAKKISGAARELRDAGLELSALRLTSVPEKFKEILGAASECSVKRIIAPLSRGSADILKAAADAGLEALFFNCALSSADASDILLRMKNDGLNPGFVFSAANFARAGEKPFLGSYKKKLGRFIRQLDAEDCLFDGAPASLANGNAEIKEMISILRCSSFSGFVSLGAMNRQAGPGGLKTAAENFVSLLDNM